MPMQDPEEEQTTLDLLYITLFCIARAYFCHAGWHRQNLPFCLPFGTIATPAWDRHGSANVTATHVQPLLGRRDYHAHAQGHMTSTGAQRLLCPPRGRRKPRTRPLRLHKGAEAVATPHEVVATSTGGTKAQRLLRPLARPSQPPRGRGGNCDAHAAFAAAQKSPRGPRG